jgi:stage V sporulation protein G
VNNMGNLKAFADIIIANNYKCKGFRIMEGQNGIFVAMPSKKNMKNDSYEDIFHPITSQGRTDLMELILNKYNEELGKQGTEPSQNQNVSSSAAENEDFSGEQTEDDIPF